MTEFIDEFEAANREGANLADYNGPTGEVPLVSTFPQYVWIVWFTKPRMEGFCIIGVFKSRAIADQAWADWLIDWTNETLEANGIIEVEVGERQWHKNKE